MYTETQERWGLKVEAATVASLVGVVGGVEGEAEEIKVTGQQT